MRGGQRAAEHPGLKPTRERAFDKAYRNAREPAAAETGLPLETFPEQAPYDLDRVVDKDFYPDPIA